ncbi:MAG: YjbQ family protein [Chlorobiaceae bacterium]|jgi:secondary thiamine-phosphate synthase enzyme|nr:YjbQ family protein [Chlorobiaceae bacterium]
MRLFTTTIALETRKALEIIDITNAVRDTLAASGLIDGTLTIISRHSTAFVNINEKEEQLLEDMETFLKRFVPRDGNYQHNINPLDGRDNAHAHLLGLLMNVSESIPFAGSKLLLGTWQSIFFIELDGPRPSREVLIQVMGI